MTRFVLDKKNLKPVFFSSQINYNTREEAHEAVELGQNIGYLWFARNFTDSIFLFNDDPELDYADDGFVQVFLDKSDMQKSTLVERKIYDAYDKFIEHLMVDCRKSRKAGKSVVTGEAMIGTMNFDFKGSMTPGYIIG